MATLPGQQSEPLSVLIADGDDAFRTLVKRRLGVAVRVVGDARDGEEAVRLAQWLRPDVVVMDIALPGVAAAARRIKAARAETKVVLLLSVDPGGGLAAGHSAATVAALRLGADAVLPKNRVRAEALAGAGRARTRGKRR
jgi:DNA-binding NarL/FixJ family response regulator